MKLVVKTSSKITPCPEKCPFYPKSINLLRDRGFSAAQRAKPVGWQKRDHVTITTVMLCPTLPHPKKLCFLGTPLPILNKNHHFLAPRLILQEVFSIILLFSFLAMPSIGFAQQEGITAQGSQLQSGGGGLQQAPAGLQGSAPQVFGGNSGGIQLDKANQNLLDQMGVPTNPDNQPKTEESIGRQDNSDSSALLISLCLVLAAFASAALFWLRRMQNI